MIGKVKEDLDNHRKWTLKIESLNYEDNNNEDLKTSLDKILNNIGNRDLSS